MNLIGYIISTELYQTSSVDELMDVGHRCGTMETPHTLRGGGLPVGMWEDTQADTC